MSLIHYLRKTPLKRIMIDVRQYRKICQKVKSCDKEFQKIYDMSLEPELLQCSNKENLLAINIRCIWIDQMNIKWMNTVQHQVPGYVASRVMQLWDEGCSSSQATDKIDKEIKDMNAEFKETVDKVIHPNCQQIAEKGVGACANCHWTEMDRKYTRAVRALKHYEKLKKEFWTEKLRPTK